MKISYNIKKEDYIEFNLEQLRESRDIKKFFILQKGVISIGFLFFILYISRYAEKPLYQFLLFYGLVLITWVLFEAIILRFIVRKKLELEIENNEELFGEKTLKIDDGGLHDLSIDSKKTLEWKDIKFIDESKKYLFIFTIPNLGYVIPKSAFISKEEKDKFINKINIYIR